MPEPTSASIRAAPTWARSRRQNAAAVYIGPWQELNLGRAIAQQQRPRHGRRRGPAPSASEADLTNFVETFKEVASQLDEDGAKNLLLWSPLFMPTVQNLLQPGSTVLDGVPPVRGTQRRARAAVAAEIAASPKKGQGGTGGTRRKSTDSSVKTQRQNRVDKLRHIYGCGEGGGPSAGGGAGASQPGAVRVAAYEPLPAISSPGVSVASGRPYVAEYASLLPSIGGAQGGGACGCASYGGSAYLPGRHDVNGAQGYSGGSQLPPNRLPPIRSPNRSRGDTRPDNFSPSGHSPTPGQYASWGAGGADEAWEDDVDDLLEWTRTLE